VRPPLLRAAGAVPVTLPPSFTATARQCACGIGRRGERVAFDLDPFHTWGMLGEHPFYAFAIANWRTVKVELSPRPRRPITTPANI
jgi:hypothetical protein